MALDKVLLDILVCPQCKGEIEVVKKGKGFECSKCKLIYPIKDDIPVMLVEKAEKIK